jgi:putative addiction module killer protein
LGDCQSLENGVFELRIDYGSGFRIYLGKIGMTIVILICGGDKSTSDRDICQAKEYWTDYRS